MKKLYIISILLLLKFITNAQTLDWVKGIGGPGTEVGTSVVVNSNGDVFTAGYYNGTVDFDPSSNVFNLTSAGGFDIYFTKIDKNGNFVWAKSIGGIGNEGSDNNIFSPTISLDGTGNIISAGYFMGTADLDPSNNTNLNFVSNGDNDIFILKMDTNGQLVWAKQIGGTLDDKARSIAVDLEENIVLTGFFNSTVDFDPNAGIELKVSLGAPNVFVTKLTSNGEYLWTNIYGGWSAQGLSIITNLSNNIIVVYWDDSDYSYHLLKLGKLGNLIFSKSSIIQGIFIGKNLKTDNDENIYLGFNFALLNNSSFSIISKFDKEGNKIEDFSINYAYGFVVVGKFAFDLDKNGNIYFACKPFFNCSVPISNKKYSKIASCGPDPNTSDIELPFEIKKIDALGNYSSLNISPNSLGANVNDIFVDFVGNVHTTGDFTGTIDFNTKPVTNTYTSNYKQSALEPAILTSVGSDSFVQKILMGPLPITLVNFSAKAQDEANLIAWQTATEINTDYFEIQRSFDGRNFTVIGNQIAKGNSNEKNNYEFVDLNPKIGLNYYRLQQFDLDGKNTISKMVAVNFEIGGYGIFPNPSKGKVNVSSKLGFKNATVKVLNALGQTVFKKENINGSDYNFEMINYSKGIFFLEISQENVLKRVKLMMD